MVLEVMSWLPEEESTRLQPCRLVLVVNLDTTRPSSLFVVTNFGTATGVAVAA